MALITAIAYDVERNLGRAYNQTLSRLQDGDWICFLDHDALFTTRSWYPQLLEAIAANPNAGILTAVTNRIGRKSQVASDAPPGHEMREHFAFGAARLKQYGASVRDITAEGAISGVLMCLSKLTWQQMGGFKDGFFGVDNRAHRDAVRTGKRILLLPGLYVYHWYRADGVGHEGAPRAAPG